MRAEELIRRDHLVMEFGYNFNMRLEFSKKTEEEIFILNCMVRYDPFQKKWHYEVEENEFFQLQELQNVKERIVEFFENELAERKQFWEERAEEILTSLSFSTESILEKKGPYPHQTNRIILKEAKIGEKKVELKIFLTPEDEFEMLRITFLEAGCFSKKRNDVTFLIKWDFAKAHLKGMEELQELLKRRYRLLFLFQS